MSMDTNRTCLGGQWVRSVDGRDLDFVTVPGAYPPMGECTLRREFICGHAASDDQRRGQERPGEQRHFLCTEGVLARATFAINGTEIGTAGPWSDYRFEIPAGLLRANAPNTIEARVRDIVEDFGPTPGRRFDAGLVRPIWIERRPAVFLEDVHFRQVLAEDHSSARCTVAVEVNGPSESGSSGGGKGSGSGNSKVSSVGENAVDIVLREADTGRVVAEAVATAARPATFSVAWPRLWSPGKPNLYCVTATLRGAQADALSDVVGFRRIEVRGPDFFLNGERLFLSGVCRHEFTHASGYSPSPDEVRREIARIRHAGFNYIRLVHSPQAGIVCRIAAEIGILVSEEPGTCFHDLAVEAIYAPAFECLRRTVKRDRNVPSIFAWLIYNECNPNTEYAVRAAGVCRELDPGCRLSMADCSGRTDDIKAMVAAADLTYYGINAYSVWPNDYCEKMKTFTDRPIVITEWGGSMGQGNPRLLKELCDSFVIHSRPGETIRLAGCSFWAWADYEEHSRPGPATTDGWTVEGLVDADGVPKPDLQILSNMCFDVAHPPAAPLPRVEVLAQAPRRTEAWEPVDLASLTASQEPLEKEIEDARQARERYAGWFIPQDRRPTAMPRFGRLMVDGIEFRCRDAEGPASPLLLGPGCEEVVIPIGRTVRAVAVLGHVALRGGYPASAIYSVHHRDNERPTPLGAPAAEYEFVFEDGTELVPLRHGLEVLRSNDICRWWTPAPRAPYTLPGVRVALDKRYEILRLDVWERRFEVARPLREIRWRLRDAEAVMAVYAVSVMKG